MQITKFLKSLQIETYFTDIIFSHSRFQISRFVYCSLLIRYKFKILSNFLLVILIYNKLVTYKVFYHQFCGLEKRKISNMLKSNVI